jgi:2-oxoglutarate dehydrogenase E1 component
VQDILDGRFEPVLLDVATSPEVTRVILTSGKVYYDLKQARDKASANVAILRLEQFYPFPQSMLVEALAQYPGATDIVWVQEEPRNMGAWPFLHERLQSLLTTGQKLHYVGRPVAASPATGSHHRHEGQQKALVGRALGL